MMARNFAGQRVVLGLVEHDLELLGVLVEALQHATLDTSGESEEAIRAHVVEFGRQSSRPRSMRRNDLAARQRS
jgi:hypothetical protein